MNSTAHPVAQDEVMAFVDGELSAAEAREVTAHLEECAECADLAAELRATSRQLSHWNVPPVPPQVEKSVQGELAGAAHDGKGKARTRRRVPLWTRWTLAVGGAVAVILVLLAVPSRHPDQPQVFYESSLSRQSVLEDRVRSPGDDEIASRAQASAPAARALQMQAMRDASTSAAKAAGQPDHSTELAATAAPMIARTVLLTIQVKDAGQARTALDAILARHHGYAAQLYGSTQGDGPRVLQASLRIPASDVGPAVAELKTIGRVQSESQSGDDVRQQHQDLEARLKTARDTEERFRSILQQRAGSIAEVLEVEQGIARVRGEIESMEAEQDALEHRVNFATIEVTLSEEYKAQLGPPADSVSTRLHNAFVAGVRHADETLLGLVLFAEEYGPVLLIWAVLLGLPVFFAWRRYRRAHSRL